MASRNFAASLAFTLVYEGGFVDHAKDPGGATMCGVTQRVYDEDRDARRLPRQSVRVSTDGERTAIYRRRYWDACHCDDLPAGVDYAVFDFAVNSGVSRSAKTLQGIVDCDADGIIGPATLARVQAYCASYHPTALTDALCVAREQFLRALPTFATFGQGWMARVAGDHAGHQVNDTGVIDRAYVMASAGEPAPPSAPTLTTKTYLAQAAQT